MELYKYKGFYDWEKWVWHTHGIPMPCICITALSDQLYVIVDCMQANKNAFLASAKSFFRPRMH